MVKKILLTSPVLFFLTFCQSNEYRMIGITNKLGEEYYYGSTFQVRLLKLEKDSLPGLKMDLKNRISGEEMKNAPEEWRAVSNLSFDKNDIFLFQLIPETRVIQEFLDFTFECNGISIQPKYRYYTLNTSVTGRTQSYPMVVGFGPSMHYYPYSYRSYTQDVQVSIHYKHVYAFVFLLPNDSCMSSKSDRFQAITPSQSKIEFGL
jgi:hypothetical protein